jgi:hypothetical protein
MPVVKATATIPAKLLCAILPSSITIILADLEMPVLYTGRNVIDPRITGNPEITRSARLPGRNENPTRAKDTKPLGWDT